jgi:hypothetical protein
MEGKYKNPSVFVLAWLRRELVRLQLASAVTWQPAKALVPGCTIVIAMPRLLPNILNANLSCLNLQPSANFSKIIVVVDGENGCLSAGFEDAIQHRFCQLKIEFRYYSATQYRLAERLKLPYVYAWLSWCIAIAEVETQTFLIHDYDALVFSNGLGNRFEAFNKTQAQVQGVSWYDGNGIEPADKLLTTFELFVRTSWARQFGPIDLFHKVALWEKRGIDFDILIRLQATHLYAQERLISPMGLDELVHPSQMIHQFTVFRKSPGARLPCFSLVNIPFYLLFGGDLSAVKQATAAIASRGNSKAFALLKDGPLMNFDLLLPEHVDWSLKQMMTACQHFKIAPRSDIIDYGNALYSLVNVATELRWGSSFASVRDWLVPAQMLHQTQHQSRLLAETCK